MLYSKIKGYILLAVICCFAIGCAKEGSESWQANELILIKSTKDVYFPNATPLGGYTDGSLWLISHSQAGSGTKPAIGNYVAFDYLGEQLPISQSKIFQTTNASKDSLLGSFSATKHYAPYFILDTIGMQASLYAALSEMHVGDTMKVMSASWLAFGPNGTTGLAANTPIIFTLILREIAADPKQRELDMVTHYVDSVNMLRQGTFVQAKDYEGSLLQGFYITYTDTVPLDSGLHYASDGDEISVKYEGHYLQDNFLLDTNIDSVAKKYSWTITTTDSSYFQYAFSEDASSTAVIKAMNISLLHVAPGSWVEAVFTSDYGYGRAGNLSNASRPVYAYTPLRFRIYVAKID